MFEPKESREKEFIDLLRKQVEIELKWGPVAQWTQRDFQSLSDLLEKKTRERLGITTLKRILGRIEQKGLPYLHTLDVMAVYLGYQNWIDFKKQNAHHFENSNSDSLNLNTGFSESDYAKQDDKPSAKKFIQIKRSSFFVLIFLFCTLFFSSAFLFFQKFIHNENHLIPAVSCELQSTNAIADSFPHEVNFQFYCPDLDPNKLNVISFEPAHMHYAVVDKKGLGSYSHVYSNPGIFQVKVFSNKDLVAQKAVLISSGGWKANLHPKTKKETQIKYTIKNGCLGIDKASLALKMPDVNKRFYTSFYMYKEMGVDGDNFQLSTRLKNTSDGILNKDKGVFLRLWGEKDYHMIQIANAFRKLEIFNRYSDVILDSIRTSKTQFQKFTKETEDWFNLSVKVKEKRIQIFFNEEKLVDTLYTKPIGDLMGLETSFVGTGEVDFIRIFDKKNNAVMREEFEE